MRSAELVSPSLRVTDNILDLIGSTPMLRLRHVVPQNGAEVYAKLEAFNPGFSIKDRAALGMVLRAENDGSLRPGATIVEATAGNTGVGLALVGVQRGYKVQFFVPEKFSREKVMLMEAFGAKVIRTPNAEGMEGAIRRARELTAGNDQYWFAAQFSNQGNPDIHYETTGREIVEQLQGRVDAVVIGAGTGGTFTGVARFVKQHCPGAMAVLVETEGSVYGGGKAGDHAVEGIGASFIPEICDMGLADRVIAVSDKDAFAMLRELAVKEGVLGGSSSGANVWAAALIARELGPGKRVATIIPDSAERYLSKDIFNFRG
ncbi:MAG TPA: cysteine synthase family protein [Clostridia bacterium]|nr:cysteine synthase family protein [Clostridia bacterium]